ncbi:MAG TPA: sugar ABC transporter substrate-binding protein [Chloroflexota bacterium]|nr:sugar ABC transporter substrate-binding protein [Chloroflexota bacterium]
MQAPKTTVATVPLTRRRLAGTAAGAAAGALALAGCRTAQPQTTAEAPRPSGQPVTLRYLGRGNQVILGIQRRIADDFEKANPRIKVEMNAATDYLQQLQAELASGSGSDVAFTAMGSFRVLAKQGGLLALDPFMARDFKRGDYYDYAIESGKYKSSYYAFPYDGGTYALAYNKELFDKAQIKYPDDTWTWDRYVQVATQLTIDQRGRRASESGFDPQQIAQYGSASVRDDYWYYIWANGGDILSEDKTRSTLDSQIAVDTIQWIADMHTKLVIMPTPAFADANPTGFESGRIALQPHGRWSVATYRQVGQFEWDVAPMPRGKAGRIGYGWFSGMSVVKTTKVPAEAWEFCKFCGTDPGQQVLAEVGQTVPPMPRLANGDLFLKSSPPANNRAYLEAITNVRLHPTAHIILSTDYGTILNPALNAVWKGEQTAKTAIPPLVPQLNDVLARG